MRPMKTESCHRVFVAGLLLIGVLFGAACSATAPEQAQAPGATSVTVFEGARVIVGDGGPPIENAAFIVLNANPLDDITNTRKIADVYLRGKAVDRAALRARWMSGAAVETSQ
jgi:hypothetical protein